MKFEDRLTEKINRKTGQTVPDGYFELVIRQVEARLPERDDLSGRPVKPLSRWHRIRPYVYLAAMFAGIWCMMKMFHDISDRSSLNIDNPPALVAQSYKRSFDRRTESRFLYFRGRGDKLRSGTGRD